MDLSEEEPVLVEVMLNYLYKGTYHISEGDVPLEDAMHKYTKVSEFRAISTIMGAYLGTMRFVKRRNTNMLHDLDS